MRQPVCVGCERVLFTTPFSNQDPEKFSTNIFWLIDLRKAPLPVEFPPPNTREICVFFTEKREVEIWWGFNTDIKIHTQPSIVVITKWINTWLLTKYTISSTVARIRPLYLQHTPNLILLTRRTYWDFTSRQTVLDGKATYLVYDSIFWWVMREFLV